MRFVRPATGSDRVDVPMSPMIDIVFQLLVFFMLNLKIIAPEGDFNINMPIGMAASDEPNQLPDLKVGLRANPDGSLAQLTFGGRNLGNDDAAFDRLNAEILKVIVKPGNPLTKDIEVEIDADFNVRYEYTIRAVSKCTGRLDPQTKRIVRYIEKVKFKPSKRPEAE